LGATFLILLAVRKQTQHGFEPLAAIMSCDLAIAALLFFWFALRGHLERCRRLILYAFSGGFIVGAIGFSVGFFGPIVFSPEANQGPLLGIFITGPIGFAFGVVIGGAVYSWKLGQRA